MTENEIFNAEGSRCQMRSFLRTSAVGHDSIPTGTTPVVPAG